MSENEKHVKFEGWFDFKKPFVIISLICLLGLSFRVYFFAPDIPLTLDALGYFWYANDLSILGHLPNYPSSNNGWPVLLSVFFSIFHSNNPLDYMILQKAVSVSFSVLTSIPIYLLCTRFFSKQYSVLGALLFVIDPRIIQNSLFGITEPLNIFLLTLSLYFFLSKKDKLIYLSFGLIALSTLVRAESIFVFFAFCIMQIVRFKFSKKSILKVSLAVIIFLLVLSPMILLRIQTNGNDGIVSRIVSGSEVITSENQQSNFSDVIIYFTKGFENFIKIFGWSLVPFFILFIPFGTYIVLKKRNYENTTLFVILLLSFLPILYAFFRSISETRYFLPLYPIFVIFSLLAIKEISGKIQNKKILFTLLVVFLLASSSIFLYFKMENMEHEKEALKIANYITENTKVINEYYPEGKYLMITKLLDTEKFPVLGADIPHSVKILPIRGFNTLNEYMEFGHREGLTHLVLDGSERNPIFLNDVFTESKKYPYLIEIFDSYEHGYKYHVKIFEVDFEKFNSTRDES